MRVLIAATLPSLWAVVVLAGAWRHRPAPVRLLAFVETNSAVPIRRSLVAKLGSLIRRAAGRTGDPARDSQVGLGAICAVLALLVSPLAALVVAGALVTAASLAARRRRREIEERIVASVPETIDLFVLAAGAGHPVHRSLRMVATRATGPVGSELQDAVGRVERGERTADALAVVAENLGEPVRALVGVLCSSERYGTPLVPALERLAAEARTDRRRRAEEAARRVPVKLLFPLVLCTLPAFALLTVVPLLVGAFGSLRF